MKAVAILPPMYLRCPLPPKPDAANFIQDGIPYLTNTKTDIDADIKIDNKTNTYTFKTDDIALNNLKLSADGLFQLAE